jgi:hypothetical protein
MRRGRPWPRSPKSWRGSEAFLTLRHGLYTAEAIARRRGAGELWTNVVGQNDQAGFYATLGELEKIGFTFGGTFAGHGAYAVGQARFHIRQFN